MARMSFPSTIYAVALTYSRAGKTLLCIEMVDVSGADPLTKEEAIARARKQAAVKMPADTVPLSEWTEELAACIWVIFTQTN